jgi:predicted secreted protein
VARPQRFEEFRFLGDRERQIVYDCDATDAETRRAIDAVVAAERATVFAPDSLAEARNRGYRPHRSEQESAAGSAP